jgi:hypothetical protein
MFAGRPICCIGQSYGLALDHDWVMIVDMVVGDGWLSSDIWYFGSECIRISLKDGSNGFLPDCLVFHVVVAPVAVAVLAILSTGKAFAVKLETSWVFAIAVLAASLVSIGKWHSWSSKAGWKLKTRPSRYVRWLTQLAHYIIEGNE